MRFALSLVFENGGDACRGFCDDGECSEEPRDLCDLFERWIVQIGLGTTELRVENETQFAGDMGGVLISGGRGTAKSHSASESCVGLTLV